MKKIIVLIAALILSLTGCAATYDQNDIKSYVKNELHISKCTVYPETTQFVDEDGYTDKVWRVSIPKTGMEFHVIEDAHWGMESLANTLRTDFDQAYLDYVKSELPKFNYLKINTAIDENGLYSANIIGKFSSKDELYDCYQELQSLKAIFTDLGHNDLMILCEIRFVDPSRTNPLPHTLVDSDFSAYLSNDITYEKLLNTFIQLALDYRYEIIGTFSNEEINNALKDYHYRIGKYTGTQERSSDFEPDKIEMYDNIISGSNGGDISIGSLYEILKQEGFPIKGDYWHYCFTGSNNDIYEVSYDFADFSCSLPDSNWSYYFKNGERESSYAYFCNHFTLSEIQDMTGLRLVKK